jgi:hypothetical protein
MKIDLDRMTCFSLAERFAQEIYTHMLSRRLARASVPLAGDYTPIPFIRTAVASIEDKWERKHFVQDIRFHFARHRTKQGSPPRWQDYVAIVRKNDARQAA